MNGIKIYHEIYGEGEPLVLIHGGLTTIGEMQGWVQPLAKTRQVIAVEMQGHGRTADTDRPMSFTHDGRRHCGAAGPSQDSECRLGGSFVRRRQCDPRGNPASGQSAAAGGDLVAFMPGPAGIPRHSEGMSQVGAAMAENMMQTPTGQFSKQWPEPQRFPRFLDKIGKMMSEDYDWSAEIAQLPMPVLLVFADNDSISQKHICRVLRAAGRRREGTGLAEHAAVEVAAGNRAWLQSLQFHDLAGGPANRWQIPRRSAHQSAGRRSSRLAGCTGAGEEALALDENRRGSVRTGELSQKKC